jgi:fatty acid amide hydrolase 2
VLGDPDRVSLAGLRVLHVPDNGFLSVSRELRDAQDRAADHLARLGAHVERRSFPRLRRSIEIWSSMLAEAGGTPFGVLLGDGEPVAVFSQLLRWAVGRSPHTLPALGLALIERYVKGSPRRTAHFVEEGRLLADEIRAALGPEGIMLYPVYPETAPRHSRPLVPPTRWAYPAILNVLEMPSTPCRSVSARAAFRSASRSRPPEATIT